MLADRILLIDDLSLEGVLRAKLRAKGFGTQRSTKTEEGGNWRCRRRNEVGCLRKALKERRTGRC